MKLLLSACKEWRDTFVSDKLLFFAELFGTVLAMIAAVILTFYAPAPPFALAMTLYIVSAIFMVYAMLKRKSAMTALLMMFYIFTSSVGLYNSL